MLTTENLRIWCPTAVRPHGLSLSLKMLRSNVSFNNNEHKRSNVHCLVRRRSA